MENRNKTGYPSIDRPWLKYYKMNAFEEANTNLERKTVWDAIEDRLGAYHDIPAIEYMGISISRQRLKESVYSWAGILRAIGVKEDDIVPVYSPFVPDLCAIIFALNMIGACSYFLRMDITPESLHEETMDCSVAIVLEDLWEGVKTEFSQERFRKVLILSTHGSLDMFEGQNRDEFIEGTILPNESGEEKYINTFYARRFLKEELERPRAPFKEKRWAFITPSSGTTAEGKVKGVVATNESALALVKYIDTSEIWYRAGDKCLNQFPPISTSLCIFFLLPLWQGETIVMDPAISEEAFYYQLTNLKPSVVVHTGSAWEVFFNRIDKEIKEGKDIDLSYAYSWIIGGEGTDKVRFEKWAEIMRKTNAQGALIKAYGASEVFSAAANDKGNVIINPNKTVLGVGVPLAGMVFGVFDESGNELKYNERGELWIKSNSTMYGYYKKTELTDEVKKNGWIRMGDLAEIDEDGVVYIWGRITDSIKCSDGKLVYLFDIAEMLKGKPDVVDAMVLKKNESQIVVSIVWDERLTGGKDDLYPEFDRIIRSMFSGELKDIYYVEYEGILPYSPTTYKKDRRRMLAMKEGYCYVDNGRIVRVDEK